MPSLNTLVGYIPSDARMRHDIPIKDIVTQKTIARAAVVRRWEVSPRADGSRFSYSLRAVTPGGAIYFGRTTGPGGDFRGKPASDTVVRRARNAR